MALAAKETRKTNAFYDDNTDDLVRVLWLGLDGRTADLERYLRRVLPRWEDKAPEFGQRVAELLRRHPAPNGVIRRFGQVAESPPAGQTLATDDLLRIEMPVRLEIEPVWPAEVAEELKAVVTERRLAQELARAGLRPTHTVILTGLPGVGKTLAARWLARELNLPLAVLNLGAVMSSFLGRTGANLRHVIAYASQQPCVLLLDELDAIAKRRDDNSDIGELKRLVTVLLQELDAWPADALLVAATNHEQLIDPAVWRRFERRIVFPAPRAEDQEKLMARLLGTEWAHLPNVTRESFSVAASRLSPADLTQIAMRTKREVIVSHGTFEPRLLANLSAAISGLPLGERRKLGLELKRRKLGQREINRLTGLARETIRSQTENAHSPDRPLCRPRRTE